MRIGNFELGGASRPMIVAEVGAAHNRSLRVACGLIAAAKAAGADMVKIQAFTPDTITANFDRPEFVINKGPWKGRHLHELYTEAHTPREWFPTLYECAADVGIPMFPSVFSFEDVEFVEAFNPPALKIASFELVDTALITAALTKQRPLILSTGMADWAEINLAASLTRSVQSVWLHCVSSYPTDMAKSMLGWMDVLRRNQQYVGLSDHSRGSDAAVIATARGACMIEKHITLTPDGDGLDDGFASGPEEFAEFVQAVKNAHAALGHIDVHSPRDDSEHRSLRRSLYAVRDIAEGAMITPLDIRSIRPGLGLAPRFYSKVIGARAAMAIPAGTPLSEHMYHEHD